MDVESLAKQLILKGMTEEQQQAVLDSIKATMVQTRELQKQRVGEQARLVIDALKKIESDIKSRYDEVGNKIEERVSSIKDGKDGRDGTNGRDGRAGADGLPGPMGPRGANGVDGRDGQDGQDGVSVTDAHIDFDGSLVISLSSGRVINVGEVVAPDLAEKIKVITNGGGTSQTVLDTLASLQTQINNIYPSQTGQAGKFLTTNGSVVSWASIVGGLTYQGTWNASTNTPTLASGVGVNGYYYIVATAGSTNLDGITDWQIGDWLMFNGTVWQKIDQSNLVTSVNGQTGAVSLTTTDINEGTNLYYTDARARASVSAGTGISYSSATGVITNAAPDQTVSLTAGTGISTSGTYPNFTVTNAAPDQTVSLTGAGTTSVTGTYPNFTITSNDQYVGTVTSVGGTGTVNGISLSGTVTSSGSLTLGGTLSGVDLTTQVTGTLPVANGGTGLTSGTSGGVPYYSASGTLTSSAALASNALVIGGGAGVAPSTTTTGANVLTALGVNVGSAGAFVVNGGALGTPLSGTLTNATGLPLSTGVTGTLAVSNGGTGATTLTANNVILGNGTSAVGFVAPSTNGNVLTSNGTTWTSAAPNSGSPSGAVMFFAMSTAPSGWLKANGAAVSRSTYSDLFTAIGTTFGVGDGSTTFNVPDLRGYFARGWDDGRGVDSGRSFGSTQTDQLQTITGNLKGCITEQTGTNFAVTGSITAGAAVRTSIIAGGSGLRSMNIGFDSAQTARSGAETRPLNLALLACIKY